MKLMIGGVNSAVPDLAAAAVMTRPILTKKKKKQNKLPRHWHATVDVYQIFTYTCCFQAYLWHVDLLCRKSTYLNSPLHNNNGEPELVKRMYFFFVAPKNMLKIRGSVGG